MRVCYLNLARRQDRNALFLSKNASCAEFQRVDAVDGRQLSFDELIREGVAEGPLTYYKMGALGNALTNKRLWDQCSATATTLTIAEDDALFNRQFAAKAASLLSGLPPDWDLILWGWNFDAILHVEILGGLAQSVMKFDPHQLGRQVTEFQDRDDEVVPLRLLGVFGTVCYSISPKGARRLNEVCFPLRDETIVIPGLGHRVLACFTLDILLNKHYPNLRAYVCFPPLVWAENDTLNSDVVQPSP